MNNNKQDQNKTSNVQVISRAANILRTLRDHPKGLSLSQIAKEVGLARSTVQRIVSTLEQENFVAQASTSGGIRLGPEIAMLAAALYQERLLSLEAEGIEVGVNGTIDLQKYQYLND